jgi:hypothetical protein
MFFQFKHGREIIQAPASRLRDRPPQGVTASMANANCTSMESLG